MIRNSIPYDVNNPVRVMLVDDSAVIRGIIAKIFETDNRFKVVSSVQNGEIAVRSVANIKPDLIMLDIEMPEMDGITALPKLLENSPRSKVVMCSTLTARGASISMRAMALGATEYICKPTTSQAAGQGSEFSSGLLSLVRSLFRLDEQGGSAPHHGATPPTGGARPPLGTGTTTNRQTMGAGMAATATATKPERQDFSYISRETPITTLPDKSSGKMFKCLAIGSSTGGPKALFEVLKAVGKVNVPIAVTQHMPPTFTKILAQHITSQCFVEAVEAEDGMEFLPSRVHVAPGGKHMLFKKDGMKVVIKLDDGPPENFCKPAVDPMYRSILDIYGGNVLCTILTGMGSDGLKGSKMLVDAGAVLVAQDKDTSVVWGMPGAVASAGICTAVLPLDDIGAWISNRLKRV